jgi:putative membrane-bound dehydrogenase-like protein
MPHAPASRTIARLSRCLLLCLVGFTAFTASAAGPVLKVLFLGDNGHHRPADRLRTLAPVLMNRGIQLVYTEDMAALNLDNLKHYNALLVYANIDAISPEQDQALFDYVNQGGGFVPLHCASYCFRNSPRIVGLIGGQFQRHAAIGVFKTTIVAPNHEIMSGFGGVETTGDEPYVHTKHNEQNRTVLELRENEPYTWTRTEGKGRVFYTAWGHDDRTWANAGFQELVERGIRWAAGQKLGEAMQDRPKIAALELIEQAGVPYYPPGLRSQGDGIWPLMQKPLPASASMQHLVVPGGFELQLVASEPDIRKPIAMSWDERGRLWIAESLDYPNRLLPPGEPGRDRLVICEDTNRDGRMDKFTVFADGLNIPTGFTFARGGVLVHQMPNTIFLKDTDGDDKADVREIVIRGWGRGDTHAGPNNLIYGHDNWIWGMLGYSGFDGTVGGKAWSFKQGFYRFRPDGSQLEFLRATNNNTWGIGVSEEGYLFGSTANNNPSVYMPIPDRYYAPAGLDAKVLGGIADTSRFVALTNRVRQVDVHWGYTAAAGHALYTARSFPKEYWNRVAFVTEPTGHLVGQFNLERKGANFQSKNPTNLIVGDDEWFAPIMAEVGPDGAVWIIDWYNYIVQHNPTPRNFERGAGNAYENKLRDQTYGRIYRIVWKDGKPSEQPNLSRATPAQLVAALTNDNLLWRRHAQRLLVERGRKDVVPALLELVRNPAQDEIGLNPGAIHALWTLSGLQALDVDPAVLAAAVDALKHPSAGVRRTAASVLPRSVANANAIIKADLLEDADPQVRLAALLALAETPESPEAGAAVFASLQKPANVPDRWTLDAAKMAASAQQLGFMKQVTSAQLTAAQQAEAAAQKNLLANGSFEQVAGNAPEGWALTNVRGTVAVAMADGGRGTARSVQLTAAEPASADLVTTLKVRRATRYELLGWIKPDNVRPIEQALGAVVSVVQVGGGQTRFTSTSIRGTRDWAPVRVNFDTGTSDEVTVACILGGGGMATGSARFDELSLIDQGPVDGTIEDPLNAVLAHMGRRLGGGKETSATASAALAAFANSVVLNLGVLPDVMKYDSPELTIKAGAPARLVFKNSDHMQHNFLLLRPGSLESVGAAADAMLTDATALAKNFIPLSADILANTPLVNPGETFELNFTAPAQPGRYPFVCTFPGHWRIMQGTLVVTP